MAAKLTKNGKVRKKGVKWVSLYEERSEKIQAYIKTYWFLYVKHPSIQMIARKFGLSTSITKRYIDKMHEDGKIEIDQHFIYPTGLRDEIKKLVEKYGPSQ